MPKNPDKIEKLCSDLKCNDNRLTKELLESRIADIAYETINLAGQKMMFCGIRMVNGFVAVGKPAVCIDPANWRDEIGQEVSYDNTFETLWQLEAYHKMYQQS